MGPAEPRLAVVVVAADEGIEPVLDTALDLELLADDALDEGVDGEDEKCRGGGLEAREAPEALGVGGVVADAGCVGSVHCFLYSETIHALYPTWVKKQ